MKIIFLLIRLPFFLIGLFLLTALFIITAPFWGGYRFIIQPSILILIFVPIKFFESALADSFDMLTSYISVSVKKWKGEVAEDLEDCVRAYSRLSSWLLQGSKE